MKVPTAVAVAWLSNSSRRLFGVSRSLATNTGAPRLEGWRLFLGAARMGRSATGRSIPTQAGVLLANTPGPHGDGKKSNNQLFLPISPALKEACCSIAESSGLIRPEELLSHVFKTDSGTRVLLGSILGKRLLASLGERLLLSEFNVDERTKILRLRKYFQGER